jgi:hypothetical protein
MRRPGWLALIWAAPAFAAGGTHVVDDSAVETPGQCNTELLGTRFAPGVDSTTLNLNCTFEAIPRLELGVGLVGARAAGAVAREAGPAFKLNVAEPATGRPGVALAGLLKFGMESGRLESLNLFVPVTFTLSPTTVLSVNAGYVHVHQVADTATFGVQLEQLAAPTLVFMVEFFSTGVGDLGGQAGIRWTPDNQLDLDLTLGHRADGIADLSVAAGLVLRF